MELTGITLLVLFLIILLIPILVGVPVAYALGLSSLAIMLLPIGPPLTVDIYPIRMLNAADSFTLLAVPFYLYAGRLLNESGATESIFEFARAMVGHLKSGIGQVNVIASLIFSGMSGSALADAAGLGQIEFKLMREANYDKDSAVAITGASAIIGPIIPPSIPLIVYGAVAQTSITDLFLAGIVPGLMMALSLMILVYFSALRRGYETTDRATLSERLSALWKAIPALITIVIIIGGILTGVFTATEAGAVAIVWILVIGSLVYDGITPSTLYEATRETVRDLGALFVIFFLATVYSFTIVAAGIPGALTDVLLDLNTGPEMTLLVITAFLLLMGMVLGPLVMIFLFVPLLAPNFGVLGLNPIHAGIVIVIALMLGLLTPPFGGILFVLEKVTDVPSLAVSRAIAPYLIPLIITLVIIIFVPETVTYVPRNFG